MDTYLYTGLQLANQLYLREMSESSSRRQQILFFTPFLQMYRKLLPSTVRIAVIIDHTKSLDHTRPPKSTHFCGYSGYSDFINLFDQFDQPLASLSIAQSFGVLSIQGRVRRAPCLQTIELHVLGQQLQNLRFHYSMCSSKIYLFDSYCILHFLVVKHNIISLIPQCPG